MSWPLIGLGAVAAWEGGWWLRRRQKRSTAFRMASVRSRMLGKPLVVIGAPDGGVTGGYGCGDLTVDIAGSGCPLSAKFDITKPLPIPDNSCVVFVSCTLEYVDNLKAAIRELVRVSGGNLYIVRVEPWTLTAFMYPGTKRRLPGWVEKWPMIERVR